MSTAPMSDTSSTGRRDRRLARVLIGEIALPLIGAAAVFVSAVPARRAYRVSDSVLVLAAAAAGSVLVSFGIARWGRRTPLVSYSASFVGLATLLLIAAGPHPVAIAHQFVSDPNRLVTETLPLSGSRVIMTALICLTWLCGAALGEVTARLAPSRPASFVALIFPLALFILTFTVASPAPGRDDISGPLLLVTLVLMAVIRRYQADASTAVVATDSWADGSSAALSPGLRNMVVGLLAAGAVTAALVAVVPSLPSMSHQPSGLHRTPKIAPAVVVDPVDSMAEFRDGNPSEPARTVMSVDLSQPSTGYLAMAVLDYYDGGTWRFDTTFVPTGGRIPSSSTVNPALLLSSGVDQQVRISSGLPIPLLPALDRPVSVAGLSALTDPTTGMLLPAQESNGGYSYQVRSHSAEVTLARVPSGDGVFTGADPSDLELPPDATSPLTTTLRFFASLTGQRPAPTVAFLQAVVTALHDKERHIDPTLAPETESPVGVPTPPTTVARPRSSKKKSAKKPRIPPPTSTTTLPTITNVGGTSLSEVIQAVTVDRAATPEQFATVTAMVARDLGVPARIVAGFRLTSSSDGAALGSGRYQVTNREAWTWVEIPVAGVGWVVVDPTPDSSTGVVQPPPEQVQAPATTVPPRQANAVPLNQIGRSHALAPRAKVTTRPARQTPIWVLVVLVVIGIVLLALLAGPGQAAGRRAWRRRSRNHADAAARTVGAWLEMLDGLSCAGMAPPEGLTNSEIAAEASIHFGPEVLPPLVEVGELAEMAIFSSRATVDLGAADHAWELRRDLLESLRAGMDRRQRIRSSLLVGSGPRRPSGPADR